MAVYNYKCVCKTCDKYEHLVEISKPMNDGGKVEFCEKCENELNKIYGGVGIGTFGDGYKA